MSKEISNHTKTEWKLLIAEYEERSVSCAEFCKLHQVSKGQVYKWRQHFLSQEELAVERSAFIPLVINNDQEPDKQNYPNITSEIRISSNSGVVIEFISGCRYLELKAIMEILHAAK
jgi:transposase-like protein